MDASLVENILEGKNAMAINLPLWGVGAIDSGTIEMRHTEAPPQFDPALSGVGWLEINNDGVHAEGRPHLDEPRCSLAGGAGIRRMSGSL